MGELQHYITWLKKKTILENVLKRIDEKREKRYNNEYNDQFCNIASGFFVENFFFGNHLLLFYGHSNNE